MNIPKFWKKYSPYIAVPTAIFALYKGFVDYILLVKDVEVARWYTFWFILAAIALTLLIFFVLTIVTINRYLDIKTDDGYIIHSELIKFTYLSKTHVQYEVIQTLQSKKVLLRTIDFEFRWSGSERTPIFASTEFHTIKKKVINDNNEFDRLKLSFKNPLLFNQIGTLQCQLEVTDKNNTHFPLISKAVRSNVSFIYFQVELTHADSSYTSEAIIERMPLDTQPGTGAYVETDRVSFNINTKSYEYPIYNPRVGYRYRMKWDKPL